MLQKWQVFLDTMQKDWELSRTDIRKALEAQDLDQFQEKFGTFTHKWFSEIRRELIQSAEITINLTSLKNCFDSLQAQRGFFAETIATLKGQRPLFANTRAWLDGRGVLFPNLRATLNGEIPFFADLRAFISLVIKLIVDYFKSNDTHEEALADAQSVFTS